MYSIYIDEEEVGVLRDIILCYLVGEREVTAEVTNYPHSLLLISLPHSQGSHPHLHPQAPLVLQSTSLSRFLILSLSCLGIRAGFLSLSSSMRNFMKPSYIINSTRVANAALPKLMTQISHVCLKKGLISFHLYARVPTWPLSSPS